MALTKQEWRDTAERAAAAKYGERHAAWLAFWRFGSVPTGIALAAAGLGLGGWWIWSHLIGPLFSGDGLDGPPLGYWLAVAVCAVLTAVAFRAHLLPFGSLLRAVVLGLAWLGILGYGMSLF